MARREEHEEHENHERWLVTYADMVTLLMVLFIVMFAMSQVDEKKFNALKSGLAAGFGQSTSVIEGSDSILDHPGVQATEPLAPNDFANNLPPAQQAAVRQAVQQQGALQQQRQYAEAQAEAERLIKILERVREALAAQGLQDDVKAAIDERGLVLSLVSRHVVFEPNLAELSQRGRLVLDTVAPVLKGLPEELSIDGHTNQVPVRPKYYATDWDLSAARAITVLRRLNEVSGIPNARMVAAAFGHERPLIDPSKPGSQAINKRVDIVVLSDLPPQTRELLLDVIEQGADGDPRVRSGAGQDAGADHHPDADTEHHAAPTTGHEDHSTNAEAGRDPSGHGEEGGA